MGLYRVGYACVPLGSTDLRSPRTTVLRHATPERLRELIAWNIENLYNTLVYNERLNIGLFRIGTQFIPFGSHPANTVNWQHEFGAELRRVGKLAQAQNQRLSFHATNYAVLNSQQNSVVGAALAEVEYQTQVLETMGLDYSHRIIVHVGTRKPTAEEAKERFFRAVEQLSTAARTRLAVENDEFYWSADEVVEIAHELHIPAVFDVLHHQVCGGHWRDRRLDQILPEVFDTWTADDGPPKIHFSTQNPEKRAGAHDEYLNEEALEAFLNETAAVFAPFDVMFEAKGKDLAVLRAAPLLQRYGVRVGPREVAAVS